MKINEKGFKTAACAAFLFVMIGCISRDNPYDPVNYIPVLRLQTHDSTLTYIESNIAALLLALGTLDSITGRFAADSLYNARLRHSNDSLRANNIRLRAYNDSIGIANIAVPPPATFGLKLLMDTLFLMRINDTSAVPALFAGFIASERHRADSLMNSVNRRFSPAVVFPQAQIESILGRYDSIFAAVSSLRSRGITQHALFAKANTDTLIPYNNSIKLENGTIKIYNDSIAFISTVRNYVHLANADSITSNLFNAVAGDRFLIGSGTFDVSVRFRNSGTVSQPILIQGQNDLSTRFNISDVVLDSNANITFSNLVFVGSQTQSVQVQNGCYGIIFRECQFRDNAGRGIVIISSDVSLFDCRIVGNQGGGMVITSSPLRSQTVLLNNVLIANNGGSGVTVTGSNMTVQNATIANHGRQAIYLADPSGDLIVTNSLITNNCGQSPNPAIYFANGYSKPYPLAIVNTNMALNGAKAGDTVNAPLSKAILHYNPMYVASQAQDFVISPNSYLDTLEKAGIIIGYRKK